MERVEIKMTCHYCTASATGHYCSDHDPVNEVEKLRQENDILTYQVERYERFLQEKGYVMQETLFVDITEDKPDA